MQFDTDIAIVGAGPVGLTLALLLAQRGRRVAIYERWGAPYPLPRAIAMSHETVRVFQSAGVLEALAPVLELDWDEDIYGDFIDAHGEVLMRTGFPGLGESGFPPMTGFNQPDVEAVLEQCCEDSPLIAVHRGWAARSTEQQDSHVALILDPVDGLAARDGEAITVTASFVVGCDGAGSTIRSLMATEVTDTGFAADWLVVDVRPFAPREFHPKLGQSLDPARPVTLAPAGPGRRRFEFMALPGETAETLASEAKTWELLGEWGVAPAEWELVRRAFYTYRGRWAETWRDGRLLLAGDAAHQMPPLMAQGFNSGVRDAIALAWRLDLVLAGKAPLDLLDSYGEERLPHVRAIVEQSVGFGRMICITDREVAAARDAQLRAMRDNPDFAPPPPPAWRLGPGVLAYDDPHTGHLAIQAKVRSDGEAMLFDELVGAGGFVAIGSGVDPLAGVGEAACNAWQALGGKAVTIGGTAGLTDVEGKYAAWFEKLGASIVVVRPDFQVYGTARDAGEVERLLLLLAEQLSGSELAAALSLAQPA